MREEISITIKNDRVDYDFSSFGLWIRFKMILAIIIYGRFTVSGDTKLNYLNNQEVK